MRFSNSPFIGHLPKDQLVLFYYPPSSPFLLDKKIHPLHETVSQQEISFQKDGHTTGKYLY